MRYLILTYYRKADGKIDESMSVSRNLKTRDIEYANVILDFKKLEVVKASMSGTQIPKDFDKIVTYYMQFYESVITRLFNENGYQVTVEKPNENTESNPPV